jgi:hypothetical protein
VTTAKTCRCCRRTRPLTEFWRDRRRPDGRNHRCRTCTRLIDAQYRRHPPAREVDPVAVERAVAGRPPEYLTIAERAEAVRQLAGWGHSDPAIARRIGVAAYTVLRIRAREGIPPGVPPTRTDYRTRRAAA